MKTTNCRSRGSHSWFEVLIFYTGGVVLALELLASRIMTPYFGVSLYIWTSILSITLMFLALGYAWGGRQSGRMDAESISYTFLLAPVLSAAALLGAVLLYPILFPKLVEIGLVAGSFIASTLLLGPSLILMAAMNPLLVAMLSANHNGAGAPAGRVFFISTVGSVAGVLICAFVIIPLLTNFRALLLLSISLCAATAILTYWTQTISRKRRRVIYILSISVAVISSGLIAIRDVYIDRISAASQTVIKATILAEYTSLYGNVKVAELSLKSSNAPPILAYLQDGIVQNRTTLDGMSISPYTYVLEGLSQAYAPNARSALVLGLGAGIVPRNLARNGLVVKAVDINQDSIRAATRFFGFDSESIDVQWEDARTYVNRCENEFDFIVVDLFQGDYAPEHLFSQEFFIDIARCLTKEGAVIMNAFLERSNALSTRTLLATVRSVFASVIVHRIPDANAFIVASKLELENARGYEIAEVPGPLRSMISAAANNGTIVADTQIRGIKPFTDERNLFNVVFAKSQMEHRIDIVKSLPPNVLLN